MRLRRSLPRRQLSKEYNRICDTDTGAVPVAEFLASDTDAAITGAGPMAGVPNVLAENTWDIHAVLLA